VHAADPRRAWACHHDLAHHAGRAERRLGRVPIRLRQLAPRRRNADRDRHHSAVAIGSPMIDRVTVYAFVAMWLYALQNVLLEVRLAKYTALGLMVYWYFTLAPLALIGIAWMYWSHQPVKLPGWPDGGIAIAIGTMFFIADYFYISAYTSGGKLMAIT